MKKLLGLLLALTLCFVFVGCKEKTDPVEEEIKELQKLTILLENEQFSKDTELPSKVSSIYKLTWKVEDNEYCEVQLIDEKYFLVVKKTGGKEIKLTATIHGLNEGAEVNKEFLIYTNLIESKDTTIADFMNKSKVANNETVTIKGTIYLICPEGYWMTDAADSYLYVYTKAEKVTDKTGKALKVGNEVSVKGKKSLYHSMIEMVEPETTVLNETSSYDFSNLAKTSTIEEIRKYAYIDGTGASARFGSVFTIEGTLIDDKFSSGYKYNIESIKTKECLVFYDKAMSEELLNSFADKVGKYVKVTGILWDTHSSGYERFVPISPAEVTTKPELTDAEVVAAIKNQLNEMGKEIASDAEFKSEIDGATLTWVSANPEVLSNEGKILKQDTQETLEVKVTVTIKLNDAEETLELTFKVLPLTTKTILEATKIALAAKEEVIQIKAKIIAIDTEKKGYFYVADETGVTFVRSEIAKYGLAVGDSARLLVKTTVYYNSNKEITPQLNVQEAEKLTEEVKVCEAVEVKIEDLAEKVTAQTTLTPEEIKGLSSSTFYGQLVKFKCYVSVRQNGDYTNVYLAVSAGTDSQAAYYQHTSLYQNEMKALDGKYVEIVAPVYGYSASAGWRIGTYISISEVK